MSIKSKTLRIARPSFLSFELFTKDLVQQRTPLTQFGLALQNISYAVVLR